jgi:L,D-peptidoglycan transpeptidase YkuD (ErfK/YbiS/YcfS/YnhG family)
MDVEVWPVRDGLVHRGVARCGDLIAACTLGRSGIATDKREGDGATPVGIFPIRRVLYRPDQEAAPRTSITSVPIDRDAGWCDDPDDPAYNRAVRLPYAGRHENLWRADRLYDLILVIGPNDAPVVAGMGSAVFVHVMRPDGGPTEGCVAFAVGDLRQILAQLDASSRVVINREPML